MGFFGNCIAKKKAVRAKGAQRRHAAGAKYRVKRDDEPACAPVYSPVFPGGAAPSPRGAWEALARVAAFAERRERAQRRDLPAGAGSSDDEFFAPLSSLRGLNVAERFAWRGR